MNKNSDATEEKKKTGIFLSYKSPTNVQQNSVTQK